MLLGHYKIFAMNEIAKIRETRGIKLLGPPFPSYTTHPIPIPYLVPFHIYPSLLRASSMCRGCWRNEVLVFILNRLPCCRLGRCSS